jgi:hypothetical protein
MNKYSYIFGLCLVGWVLNALLTFVLVPGKVSSDIRKRAQAELNSTGYEDWRVVMQGLDAILVGPILEPSQKKDPEEDFVKEVALNRTGVRKILRVDYKRRDTVDPSVKKDYTFFTIVKIDGEVSITGDFSTVITRDAAEHALIELCGPLNFKGRASVNEQLRERFDPGEMIAKMTFIKVLQNFTLDYNGKKVDISGEAESEHQAKAIGAKLRQLFGSQVPVVNRLTVNGTPVESPPKQENKPAKPANTNPKDKIQGSLSGSEVSEGLAVKEDIVFVGQVLSN